MRRSNIVNHKSRRRISVPAGRILASAASVAVFDAILAWQMQRILQWHSLAVTSLLNLARVPWSQGRSVAVLPGVSADLISTGILSANAYRDYPGYLAGAACFGLAVAYSRVPSPIKPLLLLIAAGLAAAWLSSMAGAYSAPYSPEEFCAIWYRGEVYVWLLFPVVFAIGYFALPVPLHAKLGWLTGLAAWSVAWSAVRLSMALSTFHYFGSFWMPFFFFGFGVLTDFLYLVAFYSLAISAASSRISRRAEAWR